MDGRVGRATISGVALLFALPFPFPPFPSFHPDSFFSFRLTTTMDSSRSQPPASERSPLLPYPPQGSPQPGAHATRSRRPGAVTSPARARLIVRGLVVLLVILVSAVGLAIALQEIANRSGRPKREGRINPAVLAEGRNGAVATENVVCSKIGVDGRLHRSFFAFISPGGPKHKSTKTLAYDERQRTSRMRGLGCQRSVPLCVSLCDAYTNLAIISQSSRTMARRWTQQSLPHYASARSTCFPLALVVADSWSYVTHLQHQAQPRMWPSTFAKRLRAARTKQCTEAGLGLRASVVSA